MNPDFETQSEYYGDMCDLFMQAFTAITDDWEDPCICTDRPRHTSTPARMYANAAWEVLLRHYPEIDEPWEVRFFGVDPDALRQAADDLEAFHAQP